MIVNKLFTKGKKKMKYLSVAVPCYNSQDYMCHCIDSVLSAKDDVEIIIIDDGSKDKTGEIADGYAKKYPETVRVIHQENSGHGEGVNRGVLNAKGKYFKVVDSDDWLNEEALAKLLSRIKEDDAKNTLPDMYICNYVYEHSADNTTYTMGYKNIFPEGRPFTWDEMGRFKTAQCLMMHSVVFKTDFLQNGYVCLPKHTFFVDNLFMYRPLPNVKKIVYLDVDLYRYFIGRDDQSVNEKMVIKRIDQQIYITKLMIESHNLKIIKEKNPKLYRYMMHNLAIMMIINAAFSFLSKDKEKINNFYEIWKDIKNDDKYLYRHLSYMSPAILTRLPGVPGRKIYTTGYKIAKKIVKFN